MKTNLIITICLSVLTLSRSLEAQIFLSDAPPPPPPPPVTIEEPEPVDFYAIAEKPRMYGGSDIINEHLNYPAMARRAGVNGKVFLKFTVSKQGIAKNIRVIYEKPRDMGFGNEAVKAMKKVRFKPAMQRDIPVAVSGKYLVYFKLR